MKYLVYNKYNDVLDEDGLVDSKESAMNNIKKMIDYGYGDAEDYVVYEIATAYTYVPPQDQSSLVQSESFR